MSTLCALTLIQLLLCVTTVAGNPCSGATKAITITGDGGTLYSSRYPQSYYNSETCQWLLSAASSKIIQLETLDIDVEQNGNCVDYIAAYDGTNDQAPLLKKWCGTEKASVQSSGQSVFLKFVSNAKITLKGFAIAYRQVTPYDISCKVGQITPLTVGTTPIEFTFQHPRETGSQCQWRLDAEGSQHLVLTVVTASGDISCYEGFFALHDGADTSAAEVFRWCGQSENLPFSTFYPSGSALIVINLDVSKVKHSNLALTLRAHTRPSQVVCTGIDLPVIQISKYSNPILVAFPYATDAGGDSCPVVVQSEARSSFRVDVLTVNGHSASCQSSAVSVYADNTINGKKLLESECWNDSRPIFLGRDSGVITVAPKAGVPSVVKVYATNDECAGRVYSLLPATRRFTNTIRVPHFASDYPPYKKYCIRRTLLEVDNSTDHPRVQLETMFGGLRPGSTTVKVYDGSNVSAPVLYKVSESTTIYTNVNVGSGRYLLVELSTEGLQRNSFVEMKYSSVPVTDLLKKCINVHLKATSTPQNLTSIGYPEYFPLDIPCTYSIGTDLKDNVVHLRVLDANFGFYCGTSLRIVDGDNIYSNQLALVCSGNPNFPTVIESRERSMKIQFESYNIFSNAGGWKLQYHSAPPSPPKGETEDDDDGHAVTIVGAVLGVIIAILLIVILYLALKNRRKQRAGL